MAASGYTPIQIYSSSTASQAPLAVNLTNNTLGSELAINITDGKLYYKDNSGNVQVLASKAGALGDVVGPASATDSYITAFDGTTGKLIKQITTGTGVVTALGVNTGSSGAFVVNGGALGTPSSGTVTNLTGTASININGTVGATTPTTGAFTTLSASSDVTLSGGTANGVLYLNGSKVATSGSALVFDGSNLGLGVTPSAWQSTRKVVQIVGASFQGVGNNAAMGNNYYSDGTSKYIGTGVAQLYSQESDGSHKWLTAPSGTAGNAITFTQAMTLDASGNLLVGNTSAIYNTTNRTALNVNGTNEAVISLSRGGSASTAGYLYHTSGEFRIQQVENSPMIFGTNNTERMRLDSSGNLGLGVTPSAWGPVYKAIDLNTRGLAVAGGVDAGSIGVNAYYDTSWKYKGTSSIKVTRYDQYDGQHIWSTAPSGTAGNAITFTQAMTLDASGNLGIGTSSPGARLEATSSSYPNFISNRFGTGGSSGINVWTAAQIKTSTTGQMGSGFGTQLEFALRDDDAVDNVVSAITVLRDGADNSGAFTIKTASAGTNTERLRIDSSGNVGINTTSPGSTLDVKGTLRLSGSSSGYVGLAPAAAAGSTTYTLPSADGTSGQVLSTNGSGTLSWTSAGGGSGTVTSVSWTGGIVSVATATTTPAFTVAGTSGGIPYFSSGTTWASSAALAANALVVGGGAGAAPSTVTTGANVLTALGVAVGSSGAFTTNNAANTFTAAQTFRAANSVRAEAASTQDAIVLAGRAGGTSSYAVTLTPTTLTANRTVTFPDAATTIPVATQVLTFSGPTAARTYTLPDAATTVVGTDTTQTLTNKRVTPRVLASTANSGTPTLNTDSYDMMVITGQSVAITSFTTNLSGTPTNGQRLWIAITGTTAIAITWGASFESSTVTLPTTTVTTNRLDVGFVWNATASKWRCVATA